MRYRVVYGLHYDVWELAVRIPRWEEYKTEEEAGREGESRKVSAMLTKNVIYLFYGDTIQKFFAGQRVSYSFSFLKEEICEQIGQPLTLEDIEELIERDRLEDVIFSKYLVTETDYTQFQGSLSEVYEAIERKERPSDYLHLEGEEIYGYLFESVWYQIEPEKEADCGH